MRSRRLAKGRFTYRREADGGEFPFVVVAGGRSVGRVTQRRYAEFLVWALWVEKLLRDDELLDVLGSEPVMAFIASVSGGLGLELFRRRGAGPKRKHRS